MFWLDNPLILFDDNYNDLTIPIDFVEKLNFFIKYTILFSIIMSILLQDMNFLILIPIFAIFTILVYYQYKKNKETYNNKKCTDTTIHNPFMNPSINDILENPKKPEACDIEYSTMNDNFYKGVFRDSNDLYNKDLSLRQFYTVPNTSIPNYQDKLGKWLYDRGPSCKERNSYRCLENINLDRRDLQRIGIGGNTLTTRTV